MTITAEEVDVYDANEAQIKEAIEKFIAANTPK
jgi:hypothetical protein